MEENVESASMEDLSDDRSGQPESVETESGKSAKREREANPGAIRKTQTQNILRALGNAAGTEFDSVESAAAFVARLSAMTAAASSAEQNKSHGGNDTAPVADDDGGNTRRGRVTNNDLQEQFQAMKEQMRLQEVQLRERELDGQIRQVMGDRFDSEFTDYTSNKIKSSLVEQDGEWIIVNSRNQQRYNAAGEPMTLAELVDEIARGNPKLLRQPTPAGGSGLRNTQGVFENVPGADEIVPDYTRDPAAFNAWAQRRGLGRGVGLKGVTASVTNSTQTRKVY